MQEAALTAWAGRHENIAIVQKAFCHRARMNHLAALGKWTKEHVQLLCLNKNKFPLAAFA
ncbi:hypothetical protein GCM10023262_00410 [Bartonella pachyuromydis]|uniref:fructose-bisphosphate aldolase n=1 Tax=Bartonella pachyuromydis TaxID=931097 RepID=A0ABP8VBQ8_9HYPH